MCCKKKYFIPFQYLCIICLFLLLAVGCSPKTAENPAKLTPYVAGTLQQSVPTCTELASPEMSQIIESSETAAPIAVSDTPSVEDTEPSLPTQTQTQTRTSPPFVVITHNPYPVASATITPTRTATIAVTLTRTATSTATQTPTVTVQPGWAGEWVGYFQKADGSFATGKLVITMQGTDLSATFEIGNQVINYQGFVFNDGKFATGMKLGGGNKDNFWWDLLPNGQFSGCYENKFAFCGSRPGLNQPSPCLELPTS